MVHPVSENPQPFRRRLYALTSLVSLIAAVLTLGHLLVSNLVVLTVAVAALLAAMIVGWTGLVRRGTQRAFRLFFALAALCVTLALLGPTTLAGVAVVLGLTALTAATARVAIGHRPVTPDDGLPDGVVAVGRAKRPVLILNPRSGDGAAAENGLVGEARRRGIKTVVLRPDDDLRETAEREAARGATVIGMAGGDGSQALVADIARRHDVAFVCVPAGTYNHFAQDLGLDRRDPVAALAAFGEAAECRIDLGVVNGRTFVNNVSMGVYAMIVQSEDYRATKIATTAAMLPDLIGQDASPFDLRFQGPEDEFESADLLLVSNNPYAVISPVGLGSRPRLDGGELGVIAIRARAVGGALNPVLNWTASQLRVESAGPVAVGIDGEAVQIEPPLEFATLRQALRVRLPHGALTPTVLRHTPPVRAAIGALFRVLVGKPAWK